MRKLWEHEARDFTPWLARAENLELLAEILDLELALESVEEKVGSFSADIVCTELSSRATVLIENQFEKTDHDHLGKLITYASGLDSAIIIWIAEHIREEHRSALDWLNEKTTEHISFFGLEIELWKIADSPVAPKFNVVSKPNGWSRTVANVARGDREASALKMQQLAYWQGFKAYLESQKSPVRFRTPYPQHWSDFAVGKSGCWLTCALNSQKNRASVRLNLGGAYAKQRFAELFEQKDAIEKALGYPLEWEEKPDNPLSLITSERDACDPTDEGDWPRQYSQMKDKLEGFYRVFSERLKFID